MKPVLILQHQVPETAAYLLTWLKTHGVEYEVANAGAGEPFPSSITPYAALAVMGGGIDRKSTRLNSSHVKRSRMPSSA